MRGRSDRVAAARIFREEAERAGFSRVGIARAMEPPGFHRFTEWIAAGRHAGMRYLERTAGVRSSPEKLLPGVRSIVCLAAPHRVERLAASDGSAIGRYAAGPDYHGTLRSRATRAARSAVERIGRSVRWRVCVDSTPIAERSFAAAAGLGWIGKNGCLIDRELGSYLLLAEILTDVDLPADEPVAELCGSCVRCLESCPTGAFVAPGFLDANRCIAYWTIEHRGVVPDDVKPALAEHVFGCDVCQEVCPWNPPIRRAGIGNRKRGIEESDPASISDRPPISGGSGVPTRAEWLDMGPGEWRRRFGATALNRAGRRGLQRNAAVSAGATSDLAVLPALPRAAHTLDRGLSDAARWAARLLDERIERTP
jgi:epoxyqueuosine reductase